MKFLLWKCYHNRLPSRSYLHHRGINVDKLCTVCRQQEEDIPHIFIHCTIAQKLWQSLNISTNWPNCKDNLRVDKLKNSNPSIPSTMLTWSQLFPYAIWNLWINRNNNHENNSSNHVSISSVIKQAIEYALLTTRESAPSKNIICKTHWHKPRADWFKINIDGAFHQSRVGI